MLLVNYQLSKFILGQIDDNALYYKIHLLYILINLSLSVYCLKNCLDFKKAYFIM